jgi:hypothetical protein
MWIICLGMSLLTACVSRTVYIHDICLTKEVNLKNPTCLQDSELKDLVYNNKLRTNNCH